MLRTFHPMRFEKGAIPLGKYQFARLTRQVFFLLRQCLAYGEGDHLRLLLLQASTPDPESLPATCAGLRCITGAC
jgi:hypothetical protein